MMSDSLSLIRPVGSRVNLNCSCDIAPNLPAEYIDIGITVTMSISLRDPSGRLSAITSAKPAPSVAGNVYIITAVISSFGRDQSGVYICTASVRASSSFIIGRERSIEKHITAGNILCSTLSLR